MKPSNWKLTTTAALVAGLAGAASTAAQPLYSVTELGALPGYTNCLPYKLNDRGEVVGYCAPATEDFNQAAFVWRSGLMTSIGKLSRGNYSIATAISPNGVIAGDGDTGNIRPQAWVTTNNGGLMNVFPNNGGNTHALYVDDNGTVGGYYTKSLSGWVSSWKGAIWTRDPRDPRKYRTTILPVQPGGIDPSVSYALPAAFNRVGQAAGDGQNDQISQHALFWNNDAAHTVVDLGVFSDQDGSSLAYALNDLGQVVGTSHPPFSSRAVLWNNDPAHTAIELPLLPGDNYGTAWAINNLGQILGWSTYGVPGTWEFGPGKMVLWRDGEVLDLQSLIDPLTGEGWTLTAAIAINNHGQIAALGTRAGVSRALLLTELP